MTWNLTVESKVLDDAREGKYRVVRYRPHPARARNGEEQVFSEDQTEAFLIRHGLTRDRWNDMLVQMRKDKENDQKKYEAELAAYTKELAEKRALLRHDLEEEFGLSGHPLADTLWEKVSMFVGEWRDEPDIAEHYAYFAPLMGGRL